MMIWEFQKTLARRLLAWSLISMLAGIPLWLDTYRPIKNIGIQFLAWGGIDGLIALFGWRAAEKRQQSADLETVAQETRKLRRILWLNTGLDVGYMLGGGRLLLKDDKAKRGTGLGILIQGSFLFLFDLWHVLRLRHVEQ